ncbi:MAG: hypothetical protein O3A00_27720, partial [Planctomycetota bacterium]|nr:hypothetical protein [Planctomycetota bacterium]
SDRGEFHRIFDGADVLFDRGDTVERRVQFKSKGSSVPGCNSNPKRKRGIRNVEHSFLACASGSLSIFRCRFHNAHPEDERHDNEDPCSAQLPSDDDDCIRFLGPFRRSIVAIVCCGIDSETQHRAGHG